MLQFGTTPTSKFLYLITNQTIYAIKAIVQWCNVKLRKLKKRIMSETLKKT